MDTFLIACEISKESEQYESLKKNIIKIGDNKDDYIKCFDGTWLVKTNIKACSIHETLIREVKNIGKVLVLKVDTNDVAWTPDNDAYNEWLRYLLPNPMDQ